MVVSGSNVYVVWEDLSNCPDADIFFRVSNDNGETFEPPIDLSSNTGDSVEQQMLVQLYQIRKRTTKFFSYFILF